MVGIINNFNRNHTCRKPLRKNYAVRYIRYDSLDLNTPYDIYALRKVNGMVMLTLMKNDVIYYTEIPKKYGKIIIKSVDGYKFEYRGYNSELPIMIYKNISITEI